LVDAPRRITIAGTAVSQPRS